MKIFIKNLFKLIAILLMLYGSFLIHINDWIGWLILSGGMLSFFSFEMADSYEVKR